PANSVIEYDADANKPDGYTAAVSLQGALTVTTVEADNVLDVVYTTKRSDLSYTVYYKGPNGETLLLSKTVLNRTFGETYPESAPAIYGYLPDAASKSVTVTTGTNEIIFNYGPDPSVTFAYTVNYYTDNDAGAPFHTETGRLPVNSPVPYDAAANQPAGYTGAVAVNGQAVVTTDESKNVLAVVYTTKRNDLSYTVYYRDAAGTDLEPPKPVTGRTFGVTYTETALTILGYMPDAATKTITVNGDPGQQLTFIYSVDPSQTFGYTVNYYIEDTAGQPFLTVSGAGILFSDIPYDVAANRPANYGTDHRIEGRTTVSTDASANILNVIYTNEIGAHYTVEYKEGSATGNDMLPAKTVVKDENGIDVVIGGTYEEAAPFIPGYKLTAGETDTKQITVAGNPAVDKLLFLYEIDESQLFGYTVEYYKNGATDPFHTVTGAGVITRPIPFDAVANRPAGWSSDYELEGQQTVTADAAQNVLKVIYLREGDDTMTTLGLYKKVFDNKGDLREDRQDTFRVRITGTGYDAVIDLKTGERKELVLDKGYYTVTEEDAAGYAFVTLLNKDKAFENGIQLNLTESEENVTFINRLTGGDPIDAGSIIATKYVFSNGVLLGADPNNIFTINVNGLQTVQGFGSVIEDEGAPAGNVPVEFVPAEPEQEGTVSGSAIGMSGAAGEAEDEGTAAAAGETEPEATEATGETDADATEETAGAEADTADETGASATAGGTAGGASQGGGTFSTLAEVEYDESKTVAQGGKVVFTPGEGSYRISEQTPGERYALAAIRRLYDATGSDGGYTLDVELTDGPGIAVLVLNALLPAKTQYSIHYSAGENVAGVTGMPQDTTASEGSTYTVPTATPVRAGYNFVNWLRDNGSTVLPGGSFTVTADVTLTAQWGGSTGGGSGKPVTKTILEEELPLSDFTPDHIWYIQGYENKVRPDDELTRAEAATIFFRLLADEGKYSPLTARFSDVSAGRWFTQAVAYLASTGIILGYPDGTFRPDAQITRAEFAALSARFDYLEADADANAFTDVAAGHWAKNYIESAALKGWVIGYPDGTFRPDNNLTRAEIVTVVNNMLGRDNNPVNIPDDVPQYTDLAKTHWAYGGIMEASATHEFTRDEEGSEIWSEWNIDGQSR
ncbi:MAG: S-layer homology domain-containing protein, partial [Clostridiales Family XIII bacterium]|nr:S-layer homology domain-containing protein [Clostridiales Family XIII bacterium]